MSKDEEQMLQMVLQVYANKKGELLQEL